MFQNHWVENAFFCFRTEFQGFEGFLYAVERIIKPNVHVHIFYQLADSQEITYPFIEYPFVY